MKHSKQELSGLSERITIAVKRSGHTFKEICERIGISQDAMVNYVKGRRTPPLPILMSISDITKCNYTWLLTGITPHIKTRLSLETLQYQQAEWSSNNFPNQKPYQPLLGIMEELGELTHAHLKSEQGIRTNEDHDAMKRDAIADIIIFLAGYCNQNNINLEQCVWEVWSEVRKRNWKDDYYKVKKAEVKYRET